MSFKLEASGNIKKGMFDTNDVFILDIGNEGLVTKLWGGDCGC
jgi:hypothetical protein